MVDRVIYISGAVALLGVIGYIILLKSINTTLTEDNTKIEAISQTIKHNTKVELFEDKYSRTTANETKEVVNAEDYSIGINTIIIY